MNQIVTVIKICTNAKGVHKFLKSINARYIKPREIMLDVTIKYIDIVVEDSLFSLKLFHLLLKKSEEYNLVGSLEYLFIHNLYIQTAR